MEKGKKQYWVNPLSDYLLITISGENKRTITVLGQAGQGIDTMVIPISGLTCTRDKTLCSRSPRESIFRFRPH